MASVRILFAGMTLSRGAIKFRAWSRGAARRVRSSRRVAYRFSLQHNEHRFTAGEKRTSLGKRIIFMNNININIAVTGIIYETFFYCCIAWGGTRQSGKCFLSDCQLLFKRRRAYILLRKYIIFYYAFSGKNIVPLHWSTFKSFFIFVLILKIYRKI